MTSTAGPTQEDSNRPSHLLVIDDSRTEVTGVECGQEKDGQTSNEPVRESDHGQDTDAATAVSADETSQGKSVLGEDELSPEEYERCETYVESLQRILEFADFSANRAFFAENFAEFCRNCGKSQIMS